MDRSGFPLGFVVGRTILTLLSGFFLWFGIDLLRAAYRLDSPFEFIAVFFASNLIILISAVLGLGFVLAVIRRLKKGPGDAEGEDEEETNHGAKPPDSL